MDRINDLFSKEGWIVAKNVDGKVKVTSASDSQNETYNFDKTQDNWMTLRDSSSSRLPEHENNKILEKTSQLKTPYREVASGNIATGFFLIRDLLNFQKPNNLSSHFLADGIPTGKVAVCARITSIEVKNNYNRLVVDDGTSAILCMVKKVVSEINLQDEEIINNSSISVAQDDGSDKSRILKSMELHCQKLVRDSSTDFDQSSLGVPIIIMGNLKEFQGKNFIFAASVRRITEEYFLHFLNYIVQIYEHKVNYMFE